MSYAGAHQEVGMTVDVVTETVINKPVADVSAYASDPRHTPH
jgi:hypothetical protein